MFVDTLYLITGAGPGFPVGGGANPAGRGRQHIILSKFPKTKKLHEIEKILGRGRDGTHLGCPTLDPPLNRICVF